ncbi:2,4-dichlorophenol 6-monooxygenase [Metarhizium robertsii ARSEF 23]|uniref:2,4-dichlorophenol 6-monooxygenase n=1 Tax=Metarhizium robertsii (strain ARSEF 23 / ATCC MYA-3075) TaxID=655844 RepID=E9EJV7_METRA|nr:2,4-dichlorophenol 6-monooxygenase [Metarhizium robertsii ARSEF 23]EFZ04288.2 2,4-dichlorophenol 6-monooxygenase [Metarhizium robertsii ARSEF 23]
MESQTTVPDTPGHQVEVDSLIVGTGPAGSSLACFLAYHGLKGLVVNSASSTADTPRAHITNMAALECFRDIGLEEELTRVGHGGEAMQHTRWCYSMAGEEMARVYSWGSDPRRKGDYELASPCEPIDLPQTLLEPVLATHAAQKGFRIRFNTSFVSFARDGAGRIVSTLYDEVLQLHFTVRSKYLFGADGARSRIMKQLQVPMIAKPGKGVAINVLVRADLSNLITHRMGNLHFILQPDRPHPLFGWLCIARMVKPWHEWMFILFPHQQARSEEPSEEEYAKHVGALIGDPSIDVKVLGISPWNINEIVAENYSSGNVYCLGDAVHRHPPMNGLGSNTCIQDAYNLAWKIAYVEKGLADPSLLESYSIERQPVGLSIVTRANEAFGHQMKVWESLGLLTADPEDRNKGMQELGLSTPAGAARRKAFQAAIKMTRHEFHGLGIEMDQHYLQGAIYRDDEPPSATQNVSPNASARVLEYAPSTIPGRRLPHVWLNVPCPEANVSTHDLAGKGAFCLFTGPGGENWKGAAAKVSSKYSVPINAFSIGYRQDWEDVYMEWSRVRGVEESGCVLVRPDRFVAWRSNELLANEEACEQKLGMVMSFLLKR